MTSALSYEGDDVLVVAWVTVGQIIDEDRILVRGHQDATFVVKLPRTARIGDRLRLKGQGRANPAGTRGDLYVLLRDSRRAATIDPAVCFDNPVIVDPDVATCSYCRHRLVTAKLVICPRCLTPLHLDCWTENGRKCPVYGCKP